MYREISFKSDGELINPKKQKSMSVKKNQIVRLKPCYTYIFNEEYYYIMLGKGVAFIEEMPSCKPRFNLVKIENLDYFMQNREHRSEFYAEQEQIEMFYRISQANEAFSCPRFYTYEFNDLERRLYGFKGINIVRVERY